MSMVWLEKIGFVQLLLIYLSNLAIYNNNNNNGRVVILAFEKDSGSKR